MKILLFTTNPTMDDADLVMSLFKQTGFSCDMVTSSADAFEKARNNRYAALWLEDGADRDLGSNAQILISTLAQNNINICCIGHNLTKNNWHFDE